MLTICSRRAVVLFAILACASILVSAYSISTRERFDEETLSILIARR